jgi:hypothetical protein
MDLHEGIRQHGSMGVPADSHSRAKPALDAVQNRAILYGMDETKLTIRIDRATLERAKRYARQHGTSLTRLVTSHLERLGAGDGAADDAPVTRRLTGVLPPEASLRDYRDHLERKHA